MTKPIKYGHWDGCAVRWRSWEAWLLGMDGVWRGTNAADVAHKAWVHTERTYWDKVLVKRLLKAAASNHAQAPKGVA